MGKIKIKEKQMALNPKKLGKLGKKPTSGRKKPSAKKGSTKSNLGKVNRISRSGGK